MGDGGWTVGVGDRGWNDGRWGLGDGELTVLRVKFL